MWMLMSCRCRSRWCRIAGGEAVAGDRECPAATRIQTVDECFDLCGRRRRQANALDAELVHRRIGALLAYADAFAASAAGGRIAGDVQAHRVVDAGCIAGIDANARSGSTERSGDHVVGDLHPGDAGRTTADE